MLRDSREFLKYFCQRRKVLSPEYTTEKESGDFTVQPYFYCECRIPGFENIGVGESHSKQHAELRASKHMCKQLRDMGLIEREIIEQIQLDLPDPLSDEEEEKNITDRKRPNPTQADVFGAGGWSLTNAKSRLNHYMQQTKQTKDTNIYPIGPQHKKSFMAELSLYVPMCSSYINIKEHGATKKIAGNTCALAALSQLYQMGAIEAYQSKDSKKQALSNDMPELSIPDDLAIQAESVLAQRGIELIAEPEGTDEPISVITEKPQSGVFDVQGTHVIQWGEPNIDWNPWTSRPPLNQLHLGFPEEKRDSRENIRLLEQLRCVNDTPSGVKRQMARQQLTISNLREDILQLVEQNQVVLIRGDTGSGKTTQVPQFILDSYIENCHGSKCSIIVTQPRRISAIAVSERVAAERGEALGESVGYSVRFDCVLPRQLGSILYCTTGILCRKLEIGLTGISHIIVDEIHERDINTDFLLVAIRDMIEAYPRLRVVIMSATVDVNIFSQYFSDCPVLEVLGKMYPVQQYFLEDAIEILNFKPPPSRIPPTDEDHEGETNMNLICNRDVYELSTCMAMAKMVEREICFELIESLLDYFATLGLVGSVLIFLPGWNLIYALSQHLSFLPKFSPDKYLFLPLHSSVPKEDQVKIFHPTSPGVTKVIISTNIAETSITINDVVFVIDSARAKIKHFTSYNNMTHYTTVWASKTNLEQRLGRAGRVQAGFCFHLCSQARYEALPQHMIPEILRSPLLDIVLSIKLLMLGDINSYLSRCIEPPTDVAIQEAIYLLKVKNALDMEENITPLGSIVARLPLEPRIAYMLVMSTIFGEGDTFTTITAAISFPEPYIIKGKRLAYRHRNLGKAKFSDHIALNNVYLAWLGKKQYSDEQAENFCFQYQLNKYVLNMVHDAKQQLQKILTSHGFPEECFLPRHYRVVDQESSFVVAALLCVGLYPNVAIYDNKRKLLLPEKKHALIHKTSNLCPMTNSEDIPFPSPYFVFGEKLRTKTVSAKQLSMVEIVHLALFGSNLLTVNGNLATLDSWLDLRLPFKHAAIIGGIREAMSDLLSKVALKPEYVLTMDANDNELVNLVTELVKIETFPEKHELREPIFNNAVPQTGRFRPRGPRYPRPYSHPKQGNTHIPFTPQMHQSQPHTNYQYNTATYSGASTMDHATDIEHAGRDGYMEQQDWAPRGTHYRSPGYSGRRGFPFRPRRQFSGRRPFRRNNRGQGTSYRGRERYFN